jgi:hypothetical protein
MTFLKIDRYCHVDNELANGQNRIHIRKIFFSRFCRNQLYLYICNTATVYVLLIYLTDIWHNIKYDKKILR